MNELPSLATELGVLLVNLRRIIDRNPGDLYEDAFEDTARELKELVPNGLWVSDIDHACVEVIDVKCDVNRPVVTGFYVMFRPRCGGKVECLPIALFLETHRFIGIDMLW